LGYASKRFGVFPLLYRAEDCEDTGLGFAIVSVKPSKPTIQ